MSSSTLDMERSIARCRVFLSLAAILAIYIDPTAPALTRWLPLTGGPFVVNRYWVTVLLAHLTYSLSLAWAQQRPLRRRHASRGSPPGETCSSAPPSRS